VIRLCLDVNVWIGHYLTAVRRPHPPGAVSGLAQAVFAGAYGVGPIQLVVSHAMLNTLELVMKRLPELAAAAEMARDQVEAAAGSGYLREPPSIVLGGSAAYPLLDPEDADVLNAAMAGRADLLVTSNLIDFIHGPKARTDTEILSYKDGAADVVRLNHPRLPGGLIIASPFRAAGWLLRSEPTPGGVRLTRATLDPSEPNKRALPASRRR
jgi:predicted nucleic acid-binding protein